MAKTQALNTDKMIEQFAADAGGHFGEYGGRYVSETLMPILQELEDAYNAAKDDPKFWQELHNLHQQFTGRPSPLTFAERMTNDLGGAKIYLKREDLNHTGAHKINHCMGQILLAKRMGKKRIIAETGAGQHGVATATVCAMFDMPCVIYQGAKDVERQKPNAFRMRLLGADLRPVTIGAQTLKDAISEAMRDWISNVEDTYYLLGSVVGPHPFPSMVKDFQRVVGDEVREQIVELEGRMPDVMMACVGGGCNSLGLFAPFYDQDSVEFIGVEAAGRGLSTGEHAAAIAKGSFGVYQGFASYFMQDEDGQIMEPHSVSAGLDYPGIGPEHAMLYDQGRVRYESATDNEVLEAFQYLSKMEGIIPALESAHAVAYAMKLAPTLDKDKIIVINLSGRGDKDLFTAAKEMGMAMDDMVG